MFPLPKLSLLQALGAGLLVGALASWYLTATYKDAVWGRAAERQKVEAAETLQLETEKVLAAERRLTLLNNQLELQDAEAQRTIDATLSDNKRLARQLGGLRDPGRRSSCDGAEAAAKLTGDAATTATGAELSNEATEFLLELAAEADRAAQYAKTCRAWAEDTVTEWNKQ